MRVAVTADERVGVAEAVLAELDDWAWASEAAARDVAAGRADQAVAEPSDDESDREKVAHLEDIR